MHPHWTGLQVVAPRFILGAVLVQILYTSMENIDTVDKNTPICSTIETLYNHIYRVDKMLLNCGSSGCGFDPRQAPHHIWEISREISLFFYIWGYN